MRIKTSKLKIGDYSLKIIDDEIIIRRGERVLSISYRGGIHFVDDSLLHQSDSYICETEEDLIELIKQLCKN